MSHVAWTCPHCDTNVYLEHATPVPTGGSRRGVLLMDVEALTLAIRCHMKQHYRT